MLYSSCDFSHRKPLLSLFQGSKHSFFVTWCKLSSMFLYAKSWCHENNADLASTQPFSAVLHSSKFIKLLNAFVSILDIKSKGVLGSVHNCLLCRLSNHLADKLIDIVWEAFLSSMSKAMPKIFHSKITAKTEIHKGLRPKIIIKYCTFYNDAKMELHVTFHTSKMWNLWYQFQILIRSEKEWCLLCADYVWSSFWSIFILLLNFSC